MENLDKLAEEFESEYEMLKEIRELREKKADAESIISNAIEQIGNDSFYSHGNGWVVSVDDVNSYLT
jgi:hypothetical protein